MTDDKRYTLNLATFKSYLRNWAEYNQFEKVEDPNTINLFYESFSWKDVLTEYIETHRPEFITAINDEIEKYY